MTSLPHDLAGRIKDGSPDAVLVCERTGTVRYWNIAAERVFGFRATEAAGVSMESHHP
jgi:PAS domain S-box-containing protein